MQEAMVLRHERCKFAGSSGFDWLPQDACGSHTERAVLSSTNCNEGFLPGHFNVFATSPKDATNNQIRQWLTNDDTKVAVHALALHPKSFFVGFHAEASSLIPGPESVALLVAGAYKQSPALERYSAMGEDTFQDILREPMHPPRHRLELEE
eukprot:891606-Amphidinium_carterae.1